MIYDLINEVMTSRVQQPAEFLTDRDLEMNSGWIATSYDGHELFYIPVFSSAQGQE